MTDQYEAPPDLFTAPPAVVATPAPAPAPSATVAHDLGTGVEPIALLAAAAAALVGGLAWAAVVIFGHYDIGILAWLVGAAAGAVAGNVAGGPLGAGQRLLVGAFAAAGILVGKYVIFIHEVRAALGDLLASQGISVGYVDANSAHVFIHNFGSIVSPIYGVWLSLAFLAGFRVAGGQGLLARKWW